MVSPFAEEQGEKKKEAMDGYNETANKIYSSGLKADWD